jgi:hypothetical protein
LYKPESNKPRYAVFDDIGVRLRGGRFLPRAGAHVRSF